MSGAPSNAVGARFKQFREDLENYNYARIWIALSFIAVLVAFAGAIIVASLTRHTDQPSYRLSLVEQKSLSVPPLRFELVSGIASNFSNYACATKSGRIIALASCPSGASQYPCIEMSTGGVMATPNDNSLNCILAGAPNDSTFMLRVSLPSNPNTQLFSTYIRSTDGAYVWLTQTQFTTTTNTYNTYTITSEYYTAGAANGVASMSITFPSFSTSNWIEWKPFSGWTAFGVIGGVIFFVWAIHGCVMHFLSLFLENPWEPRHIRETERPHEMRPLNARQPFFNDASSAIDQ